jgi:hypothetical protein
MMRLMPGHTSLAAGVQRGHTLRHTPSAAVTLLRHAASHRHTLSHMTHMKG